MDQTPDDRHFVFFIDCAVVALSCFLFFVACGLRELWLPYVRRHMTNVKCSSLRNVYSIGRCLACICPCVFGEFHPPFRLRIVVLEGWNLRKSDVLTQMQSYIIFRSGNNPLKSTSIRKVPIRNDTYPVVWNDVVDLEIEITDKWVSFEVVDQDTYSEDDVIGAAGIYVHEIFEKMEGRLSEVKYIERVPFQLSWQPDQGAMEEAGEIIFSLYATNPGRPLPPITQGMAADLRNAESSDE